MMTRLVSVGKKSRPPGLWAIPSRAFSQLSQCPNSDFGLGMSDLEEVKDLVTKFEQDLKTIRNRDKKSSAIADCLTTHCIVQILIDDLQYPNSKAIDKVSQAEAKLVSNSLKVDPAFKGVSWKDLF